MKAAHALAIILAAFAWTAHAIGDDAMKLTVLTFNIRYGTADDGPDRWQERRELALGVLDRAKADVVGLQEALDFQIAEMTERHPEYGVVGVGRDDGRTGGEHSAILYRTDRFAVAEAGTFWLSDTPGVVASTSWGNSITRICTWVRLIDRRTGAGVYVFNAHLDHRSQESREKSTRLIAERINARSTPDPFVLTGDFNAGESNPAVTYLLDRSEGAVGPGWVDTYRAAHPDEREVGTFNAFKGERTGDKIDYVIVAPGARVLDAAIDRWSKDGRYPSDHFPVRATIEWPGGGG